MPQYYLKLYVKGLTERSEAAVCGLHALLARLDGDDHRHEIVDVLEAPEAVEDENMLASPTLVRMWPPPHGRVMGDLSDTVAVAEALGLVLRARSGGHAG